MKKIFLSLSFTLLACGGSAATSSTTSSAGADVETASGFELASQEVEYEVGGVKLKGYMAWNANQGGARPGVIIVHEWWGHNDYAKRRAAMLAELGYTGMAVDMYGDGKTADHPEQAGELMNGLLADLSVVRARFDSALQALRGHPTTDDSKMAAIGYCMGGGIVVHAARYGADLAAVASFHGSIALGVAPAGEGGEIKGRVVAYNGEDDSFIPREDIDGLQSEMDALNADYQFINIPGALHGFTNRLATSNGEKYGIPLRYSERADRCSWDHMSLLLEGVFSA